MQSSTPAAATLDDDGGPGGGDGAFWRTLAGLTERVDGDADLTSREREEGRAYLAGMARVAIDRAFVSADTEHPRFVSCIDFFGRWGMDSVDNVYLSAGVRGDATYRIRGNVGSCADVVVETLAGMVGDDGRTLGAGVGVIDFGTLRTDADGGYEIVVGPERGDAVNFVPSGPEVNTVFVRKTFERWDDRDPGWQTIERVGADGVPNRFYRPGDTQARWAEAARLLGNQVGFLERFSGGWRAASPPNVLSAPTTNASGYVPGQYNAAGHFDLGPEQCLLISTAPVDCRYMSVAVGHIRWFCSFDGGESPSQLNRAQSRPDGDGVLRHVIAARDPGVPNWLSTTGHPRGFIFCRWQGVTGEPPYAPEVELLDLADLPDRLPSDTPRVGPAERAAQIRRRRLVLDRRHSR